jgi:hypothetical protein
LTITRDIVIREGFPLLSSIQTMSAAAGGFRETAIMRDFAVQDKVGTDSNNQSPRLKILQYQ